MFTRNLPGEDACDALNLRHAAEAQRLRRCQRRLRQIELARYELSQYDLTRAQLAAGALHAANAGAARPRRGTP